MLRHMHASRRTAMRPDLRRLRYMRAMEGVTRDRRTGPLYKFAMAFPNLPSSNSSPDFALLTNSSSVLAQSPSRVFSQPSLASLGRREPYQRVGQRQTYPPQPRRRRLRALRPAHPTPIAVNWILATSEAPADYYNVPASMASNMDLVPAHMNLWGQYEGCICALEGTCSWCIGSAIHDGRLTRDEAESGSGLSYSDLSFRSQPPMPFLTDDMFSEPAEYDAAALHYSPIGTTSSNPHSQYGFTGLDASPYTQKSVRNDSTATHSSAASSNKNPRVAKSRSSTQSSTESSKASGSPQFFCRYCPKSFTVDRNKSRHEESSCPGVPEDQKKDWPCAEAGCASKFRRSDGLTKHYTDVHRKCTRCVDELGMSAVFSSSEEIKDHKLACHQVPIRTTAGPQ